MRIFVAWSWVIFALAAGSPSRSSAQENHHAYAIVVGTNLGGVGQGSLMYAERDAERVAQVLSELGRTPRENIRLLTRPRVRDVELALAGLRSKLAAHAARGERTQVLFYYSGHARAHALSLGEEELSLETLRTALMALPGTLKVAVLDACQSGAFSGIKGAAPAADFSVSSVNELRSEGIAVLASSTATELSQESRELGSSYFTHHLVVALRGAADDNSDGRVSLDEAYRYAYERTLADTARTQVGGQHATLETELKGRGDVPLTYPVDADAQLTLPEALVGRVLVQRDKHGSVMAELIKARGAALRLALPSGRYGVLVRQEGATHAYDCEVDLERGEAVDLSLERCARVGLPTKQAKGTGPRELWFVELGFGFELARNDGNYIWTLEGFQFRDTSLEALRARDLVEASAGFAVHRYLTLVGRFEPLQRRRFTRTLRNQDEGAQEETFDWNSRAILVGLRARYPLAREWFVPFLEVTGGVGFTRSRLATMDARSVERQRGAALRVSSGFTVGIWKNLGAYLSTSYTFAPVLENRVGDRHDNGAIEMSTGLRLRGFTKGH